MRVVYLILMHLNQVYGKCRLVLKFSIYETILVKVLRLRGASELPGGLGGKAQLHWPRLPRHIYYFLNIYSTYFQVIIIFFVKYKLAKLITLRSKY